MLECPQGRSATSAFFVRVEIAHPSFLVTHVATAAILKPSKYTTDGYVVRFRRGFNSNSAVAAV